MAAGLDTGAGRSGAMLNSLKPSGTFDEDGPFSPPQPLTFGEVAPKVKEKGVCMCVCVRNDYIV
jgi:hypothetical protein